MTGAEVEEEEVGEVEEEEEVMLEEKAPMGVTVKPGVENVAGRMVVGPLIAAGAKEFDDTAVVVVVVIVVVVAGTSTSVETAGGAIEEITVGTPL